ncbi:MAG: ABC transporter substrate-binding protein, partial [Gemmatimonadota bacterium]
VRPTAYPLYGWTRLAILPEHILGDVPSAELATHPFGTTEPVGNGPFRFVERVPGDRWVFEANPDFPEDLGGRPYVDRYVYRAIPDDAALTAALRTGEVDMVRLPAPAELPRLAADTSVTLIEYEAPEYDFIAWNSRRPMFAEAAVRRALTMAIDRGALVTALLEGHGDVAVGPVGPWHWAFDASDEPIPFAPDSARAELTAAGWGDADGDGILDRDGQPFAFELFAAPRDKWRDIATAVQANLRDVGIDMTIEIREPAAIGPLVFSPDRRYDALLLGWSRDVPLDDRELWACERIEQPFQFTSYCDPALDAVLDSMQVIADRGRLDALVDRYNGIMARDQPYTFLYYADHVVAARVELRGATMDSRGDWVSVTDWWLEPAARARRP